MDFAIAQNATTLPAPYNQNSPADQNSVSTFIDGLFANGNGQVRNPTAMQNGILAAAQADQPGYWLIDVAAQAAILELWRTIWMNHVRNIANNVQNGVPATTQATDIALFESIAAYVQANRIAIYIPDITYVGPDAGPNTSPVYSIAGYERADLFLTPQEIAQPNGDAATAKVLNILAFMELFATGAHFVAINSSVDIPDGTPPAFLDMFQNHGALHTNTSTTYMHSHYSGAKGLTNIGAGYAYPNTVGGSSQETYAGWQTDGFWGSIFGAVGGAVSDIVNADIAPVPCPFVCSLLAGNTSRRAPNTFFQLEGWPGILSRGFGAKGRHGQDFAVHQATKWNISTYGASPFSEKRGTTVFLAPNNWQPQQRVTTWTSYCGSQTLQGWYDTNLIRPAPV
ncbi:hypothetical protein [Thalassospira lucentensis]|uniref:Uncharacterized protein n=1 Tax=Thalassospira lucentensis TaxID=168935 RepID=A0A358HX02_9PROT|nr:hypothetical protein [Thalassospira lucentensis]HBU99705.1 hypothetical protein [Thalassospira lucentensis]HCW66382.1 hypothetical protein [Thalassospira lucentensis]|tara:strand:+ start:5566 stop:6756 length:1191 start_codon:yes stop_codon:yes gene_type:complete